jgi:hypothetical protein
VTVATQARCNTHSDSTLQRGKRRVKAKAHTACANCGEVRPEPKTFSYVSRAEWERDEFCSASCAREHFGTTVTLPSGGYGIDYGATARKTA